MPSYIVGLSAAGLIGILLFIGTIGKSAQWPLHVWLPDAMEGPSPVSALIHAATMVAAGVFLVARTFPLFEAAPGALLFVASIGLITTLAAGGMSMVVTDLKRILAYSTISHLGLMMLALGAGGLTAGIFHLLTHGVSKALLFLGAGSVMHAMNGELDIRKMGGLRHRMPITAYTFVLGALSLAGIPIFAGFFSKDEILLSVLHGLNPIFFVLLLVAVFISAFYMARAIFVPFFGGMSHDSEHAHESPPPMTMPLVLLGVLAVIVGLIALPWTAGYGGFGTFFFNPAEGPEHFDFNWGLAIGATLVSLSAFALAWGMYVRKALSGQMFINAAPWLHRFLVNKLYLDDLYQWAIDHVALVVARFIAFFDRAVINDIAVNQTANLTRDSGEQLRYHVSGKVYNYAFAVVVGAVAIALAWWILAA
jgi:NADH-quinone oxidoreductase subunit L